MRNNSRFTIGIVFLVLVLCLSLLNVGTASADEGNPTEPPVAPEETTEPPVNPPALTEEPTEEPTEEAAEPPADSPILTEEPTAEPIVEATSIPVEPGNIGSATEEPAEEPIVDLLAQIPDTTDLIVLDENGEPVSLALQEAADIVAEGDPMWCPENTPPNGTDCVAFAVPGNTPNENITLLLSTMQTNAGGYYSRNGVIYFENTVLFNGNFVLDDSASSLGTSYATLSTFNITLRGGWDGGGSSGFTGQTVFDNNTNAGIRVGSNTNPWVGNVIIQDILVRDTTTASSFEVHTTSGDVTFNNVNVNDSRNNVAVNITTTTGAVTLNDLDINATWNNDSLDVTTTSGNITLDESDITTQRDARTANLITQSGDILIQNGSTFDGRVSFGSQGFFAQTNTGSIIMTGTSTAPIEFTNAGNSGGNIYNGANLSAPTVTLTYVLANANELNGIFISNANTVNLTDVTATGNGTNPPGPNNELGSGVFVDGTGSTIVTVTGGTFSNNRRYGVELTNGTLYEALAPTCSGNGLLGPNNNPCYNVTQIINFPPTLNLPGDITAEATGPSGATVSFTVTATDPEDDPDPTPSCDASSGSTFPLGTTTVNCSVTDSGGASASGSFTVTIVDTTSPVLNLPGNITVEATGLSGAIVTFTATATDIVDGSVPVSCSPASGSTFPFGTTPVNCSATDSHGNTASGGFAVTVQDTTPPALSLPGNITVEATGPSGAVVTFTATATDTVDGSVPVSCSPASGSTFPLGTTTVDCSATDSHGNTASGSFTVTVQDTTPPTLSLPANITVEATGPSGAVVTFTATATDIVDGPVPVSCSPASGSTFPLGTTTVDCSATDSHGNTAFGSFTVTVVDTGFPILILPGNITVEATGPSGAAVSFTVTATDTVDGSVPVSCTPASGSTFPLGTTTVDCSATDSSGNTTFGSFTVTVQDTTPPALSLPGNITVEATGPSGAVVTFTATATDIVDGSVPVSCTPASGSTFPFGTTPVNCSATDSHGNTASGSFTVTVQDTTPPTLSLPANITVEATGPSGAVVTFTATATDTVDGSVPVSCSPASGSTFPLGTSVVNCSATDSHGNTALGSFTVTVQDTTPPTLSLPADITVEATGPSGAVVSFTATATDIVDGPVPVSCSPASGSTFGITTTTVNCSATDSHGNSAFGSFNVTVQDTTPPVISLAGDILLGTGNPAGRRVRYTSPLTNDIVDGMGIATCTPPSRSFFTPGVTTVTCTATDAHGNGAVPVTFTITIEYHFGLVIEVEGGVIPVTSHSVVDILCPSSGYIEELEGLRVTFINLCGIYQGLLLKEEENDLRGYLPEGETFLNGLSVHILKDGRAVHPLPADSNVSIEFQIPDGSQAEDLIILFWDSTKWVELDAQTTDDGYLQANTTRGGMFVLVKK